MPKVKLTVNNRMRGSLGRINLDRKGKKVGKKLKVEINVKAHKGDKKELASSIKHELTHAKYPKMSEKEVYKRTRKTKITPQEQTNLLSKLRMAKINNKIGAIKRKLKIGRKDRVEPGTFISKINESKANFKKGVYGLI